MLTGKKERYLNIFPKPGVSEKDIADVREFGQTVGNYLKQGTWEGMQDELIKKKAVEIDYKLMFIEARAKPIFTIWAKFIAGRKNRTRWLSVFKYYLFVALFLGAPILLALDAILLKPFSSKRINTKRLSYLQVIN
jgi:hypothetical protein